MQELIASAEKGALFSSKHLAVGVKQELVRDLLRRAFPLERVVSEELRVRLEGAEVVFQSNQSLVTLRGRVSHTHSPETFADLTLLGGLHQFEVDARRGHLTARVALDRFEVQRTASAETDRDALKDLMGSVGEPGLASLAEGLPRVEIPVRFEKAIELEGMSGGPVSVAAARLPFRIAIARVVPLSGRLWLALEVSTASAGGGGS